MLYEGAGAEIVRDNMGRVEYRRDPECLWQELVGDLKRLVVAVCRRAALANAIRA